MKAISTTLFTAVTAACLALPLYAGAQESTDDYLFFDSFESGDMSATNDDGFSWGRNNRTSIVTMNPGPTRVWHNGPTDNPGPEGADWTAYEGDYSLRFRYPAGEPWAEQRFRIGNQYPEIWISFWLRVPENFYHPTGNNNQKLFAIWMDDYEFEGAGQTVVWQFRRHGDGGSISRIYHVATDMGQSGRHSGEASGLEPFISIPEDRGRWMKLVFRVVAATSEAHADGIMQMWRRWDGESNYTLLHDVRDAILHAPNSSTYGFQAGYIMGWANAAYREDTEFLVDKFVLSTESLIISPPNPPAGVEIQKN